MICETEFPDVTRIFCLQIERIDLLKINVEKDKLDVLLNRVHIQNWSFKLTVLKVLQKGLIKMGIGTRNCVTGF